MTGFNPKNPTKYQGTDKYITFFVSRNREPTGADYRQPETGSLYANGTVWQVSKNPTTGTEGDLWMLSKIVANVAYWVQIANGTPSTGGVLSLSDDADVKTYPDVDGNIKLMGSESTNSGITTTITFVSGVNEIVAQIEQTGSAPDLHLPRYIVGDVNNGANYSTWAAAIAAAPAGEVIGIQPGSYTENISISKTLSFVGLSAGIHGVVFNGKVTLATDSEALIAAFQGIDFLNTGDYNFVVTGANNQVVFYQCGLGGSFPFLNGTQPSQDFTCINCEISGVLATNSAMTINLIDCLYNFTASPLTISSNLYVRNSFMNVPVVTSGNGFVEILNTKFGTQLSGFINQTWITTAGTGGAFVSQCEIASGTQSAISVGAGTTATVVNNTVQSSNTNVFTGLGTINTGGNVCTVSSGNNVSTINSLTTI